MTNKAISDSLTHNSNPLLKVVPATDQDMHEVWVWRNDQFTREMSINNKPIALDDHEIWFKNALNDKNHYLYIGTLNNDKIGICRFHIDKARHQASVGININPQFRNMKLSSQLLAQSIKQLHTRVNTPIIATIRKSNLRSIKCFKTAGFILDHEDQDYFYYKLLP